MPAGKHVLGYEFTSEADNRGRGRLLIDGAQVGTVEIARTWPVRAVQGGLTCGRDSGLAISDAYECPFSFTGIINSVVVELGAEDKAGAEAAAMAVWPPPLAR